jgi:hypothetical protein
MVTPASKSNRGANQPARENTNEIRAFRAAARAGRGGRLGRHLHCRGPQLQPAGAERLHDRRNRGIVARPARRPYLEVVPDRRAQREVVVAVAEAEMPAHPAADARRARVAARGRRHQALDRRGLLDVERQIELAEQRVVLVAGVARERAGDGDAEQRRADAMQAHLQRRVVWRPRSADELVALPREPEPRRQRLAGTRQAERVARRRRRIVAEVAGQQLQQVAVCAEHERRVAPLEIDYRERRRCCRRRPATVAPGRGQQRGQREPCERAAGRR